MLRDGRTREFLAKRGLDVRDGRSLVGSLVSRLRAYYADRERGGSDVPFPHEVGVILGYPLDDVTGFMSGASESCHGKWRCYGDPEQARRRFEALDAIGRSCIRSYQSGTPLRNLVAPRKTMIRQ